MRGLYKIMICLFVALFVSKWISVYAYDRASESCVNHANKSCLDYMHDDKGNLVPYCYSPEIDNVSSCMLVSDVNQLSSKMDSLNSVIREYCLTAFSEDQIHWRLYFSSYVWDGGWKWDDRRTFDSQQSLFNYAFCSSFLSEGRKIFVPEAFKNKKWTIADWFKGDIVDHIRLSQIGSNGENLCTINNWSLSDDCDMSVYATDIFSTVMSDIFKIKYAQVFQVNSVKSLEDKDKRVQSFLSWYFKFSEDFKTLKARFPETIWVINSNQNFYKRSLNSVQLLDNDMLADLVMEAEGFSCATGFNVVWKNFIACALHGWDWRNSSLDNAFMTMYYNEILNYRMFVSYYNHWLEEKQNTSDARIKKKWLDQENNLQRRVNLQLAAADETLQDLDELVLTYPIHIWFLLYEEQVKTFRDKNLSKAVTSFYSLSEKLQNVQTTD